MASIAQAVTTSSVSGAANSSNTDTSTVQPAPPSVDGVPSRAQDTVNLTETGGRLTSVALHNGKGPSPFQVAYFPPSGAPGAEAQPTHETSQAAAAATNSPTAQVANAAKTAAASSSNSTSVVTQGSMLSSASQAKLQQLNQILQQLGINPTQISFADRIALLPLVNDPAAIQQYVQGLPSGAAVLNPATSRVLAPSTLTDQTSPTQSATLSTANTSDAALASTAPQKQGTPTTTTAQPYLPAGAPISAGAFPQARAEANGRKVNISV